MVYLLYIIITLLIAIVYSLQQRIWQTETYHLEIKYPPGKNKDMDNVVRKTKNSESQAESTDIPPEEDPRAIPHDTEIEYTPFEEFQKLL